MFQFQRFIFNTDAADTKGGAPDVIVTPTAADSEVGKTPEPVKAAIDPEILKELEELRAFKETISKKDPEKTPEQLAKEAKMEQANLIKYATENDLASPEDFTTFDNLKSKADRDLVFEKFAAEFKEDNPEIEADDLENEIKSAFEKEYRLDATSEKVKARGLAKLSKEANELRSPFETKINKAREGFADMKNVSAKFPAYKKMLDEIITEAVPEKMVVYKGKEGEEDITVDVELTADEKKEIAKSFENEKTFHAFLNKPEEFKANLSKKIQSALKARKFDEAVKQSYTTGIGVGTKKGSNIGAEQPFGLVKQNGSNAKIVNMDEHNAKAAEASNKLRNR